MTEPIRGSRTTRAAGRASGVALVAVLAAALSGCVPIFSILGGGSSGSGSTSTPTMEQVDAELEPYYHQVLSWATCGSGLQCATAIAPLDWAEPSGERIDLALVRHVATGERLGSLLVNPGGPGGSGWDFVHDSLEFAVGEPLIEAYDIVGFDPRGVGRSSAVSCGTDAELDDFFYGLYANPVGTDAWFAEVEASDVEWGQACLDGTGELLGHVDTVSAARDLDMLRAALGDEKLAYLGYSYGTYLGAHYAELFPEKAGRLVLDGAVDPAASAVQETIFQAKGFEDAFRAYAADCLTREECPFAGLTVDGAAEQVRALLDHLAANPIPAADGRELGADTMFTAIILPLYSEDNWSFLDQLFDDVKAGGTDVAFFLSDFYFDRESDGTYTTNSTEAFIAINCLDLPPGETPTDEAVLRAEATEEAQQIIAAAPLFGPSMAWGTGCWAWPFDGVGSRDAITAPGSPDILVIGTTNDPATPYQEAVNLAEQLEKGHLVTYNGEGHTAYNGDSACINSTVEDFLIDGVVPSGDPNC